MSDPRSFFGPPTSAEIPSKQHNEAHGGPSRGRRRQMSRARDAASDPTFGRTIFVRATVAMTTIGAKANSAVA